MSILTFAFFVYFIIKLLMLMRKWITFVPYKLNISKHTFNCLIYILHNDIYKLYGTICIEYMHANALCSACVFIYFTDISYN